MVGIASKGSQHGLETGKQAQVPAAGWCTEQAVQRQGWTQEQQVPARGMAAWRGGRSHCSRCQLGADSTLLGKHTVTAQPLPKGRKAKSHPQHPKWRETGPSGVTSRTVGDGDIAAWSDITVSTAAR